MSQVKLKKYTKNNLNFFEETKIHKKQFCATDKVKKIHKKYHVTGISKKVPKIY